MKKYFVACVLWMASLTLSAADPIEVEVIFENHTQYAFESGQLQLMSDDQSGLYQIKSLENFSLKVLDKGKYRFRFTAEGFVTYTSYPAKINRKNNTVRVILKEKNGSFSSALQFSKKAISPHTGGPGATITKYSDKVLTEKKAKGEVFFILHGLTPTLPESHEAFTEKYGIRFRTENCVVTPASFKKANEQNKRIAEYLSNEFGDDWKADLPLTPFGINRE